MAVEPLAAGVVLTSVTTIRRYTNVYLIIIIILST